MSVLKCVTVAVLLIPVVRALRGPAVETVAPRLLPQPRVRRRRLRARGYHLCRRRRLHRL